MFQLQAARQETNDAVTRLKELEGELMASRERCAQQAQELLTKSSKYNETKHTSNKANSYMDMDME